MIGASLEQNGGIATVENLILKYAPDEIIMQHITSHDEGSIIHRLLVFIQGVGKFLSQILFDRVDIVYIQISDGGSVLRKAIIAKIALGFGKPVVIHAHGAEFPKTYDRLPTWAQQSLNRTFDQASAFIVLSQSWRSFYISNCALNPDRVFVLKNPTEMPELIPDRASKAGKVTAIFCGRIGQRKGAFDLIQAFAKLSPQQQQSSQLIMAGDGDLETAHKLVESFNLQEQIIFPGWINSAQREELLATADLFILPSYHEGLPMAILEAMSWGLPIISTTVGGIPEIVIDHQNGLLVEPGDIGGLAQSIESLIITKSLRLALGENARNSVKSFDINYYWTELSEIFYRCARQ